MTRSPTWATSGNSRYKHIPLQQKGDWTAPICSPYESSKRWERSRSRQVDALPLCGACSRVAARIMDAYVIETVKIHVRGKGEQ